MEKYDFILKRRSIRNYKKNKEIPNKDIKIILEAAKKAPNPYKYKTWKLIVIKDRDLIKKIGSLNGSQNWIGSASLIVVGVIRPVKGAAKWKIVDITIALQNLLLISEAIGYGTCWVGSFNEKNLKLLLDIPENCKILTYITIGFKDEVPEDREYCSIQEFSFLNKWGNEID